MKKTLEQVIKEKGLTELEAYELIKRALDQGPTEAELEEQDYDVERTRRAAAEAECDEELLDGFYGEDGEFNEFF